MRARHGLAIACLATGLAVPAAPALAGVRSEAAGLGVEVCTYNGLLFILTLNPLPTQGQCPTSSPTRSPARPAPVSQSAYPLEPSPAAASPPPLPSAPPAALPVRATSAASARTRPARAVRTVAAVPPPPPDGYSFDRTLRIPLKTSRSTLRQTIVIVGIALAGATLAGLGAVTRREADSAADRGAGT